MTMHELQARKSARSRCHSASRDSARSNIKLSAQIAREASPVHAGGHLLMTRNPLDQRPGTSSHRSPTSSAAIKSP